MALTMLDKTNDRADKSAWPAQSPQNSSASDKPIMAASAPRSCRKTSARGCGSSGSPPGQRIGFHRHVLDYFWTCVTGGRGRQHVHDGTTVEYSYQPGETRHETYAAGQYKVHDLENIGDKEMVFMTVEFLNSANNRLPFPIRCAPPRRAGAALL